MNTEISQLSAAETKLLMQVTLEMRLSELKDFINASIQYGPPISLGGRLHRIDQDLIFPVCWQALMEFVSWGAGIVVHDQDDQSCSLLVDSAHAERLLRLVEKHLHSDSGQGEKQAILNCPNRLPPIKPPKKPEDSVELGR